MRRIRFTYEDDGKKFCAETSSESCLSDLCPLFEGFLRGAGYYFDGHVDIVDDEDEELDEELNDKGNAMSST